MANEQSCAFCDFGITNSGGVYTRDQKITALLERLIQTQGRDDLTPEKIARINVTIQVLQEELTKLSRLAGERFGKDNLLRHCDKAVGATRLTPAVIKAQQQCPGFDNGLNTRFRGSSDQTPRILQSVARIIGLVR